MTLHLHSDEDSEVDESIDLVLLFTLEGQAELEEDGEAVWFSDADDDFQKEFDGDFLSDADALRVLTWLEKNGLLESDEVPLVEVEIENSDSDNIPDSHH